MKHFIASLSLLFTCRFSFGQQLLMPGLVFENNPHNYRSYNSIPDYGLNRVKDLVANADMDLAKQYGPQLLPEQAYRAFSLRERFTYNMIFPEQHSQICSAMIDASDPGKKIFARLFYAFGEYRWSVRQEQFFRDNKDSVLYWIREIASKSGHVGVNFKYAIVDLKAWQMIPFLITFYKQHREDHDILTVLMLLMLDEKFRLFPQSKLYQILYGPDSNYRSDTDFTRNNELLILDLAILFHHNKQNRGIK